MKRFPNRAAEYRQRAAQAREKAENATGKERETLLLDADAFERMAAWEDTSNPDPPANDHG